MSTTRVMARVAFNGHMLTITKVEDGTILLKKKVGETFHHSNQMRDWHVERANKKTAVLVKYRDCGEALEKCFLKDGAEGLWALTSGAARRGLFHRPKWSVETDKFIKDTLGDMMGFVLDSTDPNGQYTEYACWTANKAFSEHIVTDGTDDEEDFEIFSTEVSGQKRHHVANATWMVIVRKEANRAPRFILRTEQKITKDFMKEVFLQMESYYKRFL